MGEDWTIFAFTHQFRNFRMWNILQYLWNTLLFHNECINRYSLNHCKQRFKAWSNIQLDTILVLRHFRTDVIYHYAIYTKFRNIFKIMLSNRITDLIVHFVTILLQALTVICRLHNLWVIFYIPFNLFPAIVFSFIAHVFTCGH
jgi:hypothetical protein